MSKVAKRVRDLATFSCALDSKLRACDLVRLRMSDVAPGGALRPDRTEKHFATVFLVLAGSR
jgi:hypothetical protein